MVAKSFCAPSKSAQICSYHTHIHSAQVLGSKNDQSLTNSKYSEPKFQPKTLKQSHRNVILDMKTCIREKNSEESL